MRVLFISSANRNGISPIVKSQGKSLEKIGITVEYFGIKGKGIRGYWQNIRPLRNHLRQQSYDIVHAHYSLSAFCASMAGAQPLVVSLMGSDVKANSIYCLLIKLFVFFYQWKAIIVKSEDMRLSLGIKKAFVIPNGVDMEVFRPMDKLACQQQLSWDSNKKHILFPANPKRYEKNYALAEQALRELNDTTIQIHCFENIPHAQTPIWYNAADVVLLTSLWEGSPNAIKEAMACNCPVVATDVGDVAWLFGNEPGYFLTDFSPETCAIQIEKALAFSKEKGRTRGRQRLIELGLESSEVAKKIINLYKEVILNK